MSDSLAGAPKVGSLADLLAIAYQIEADAVTRHIMLAKQMEVYNKFGWGDELQ